MIVRRGRERGGRLALAPIHRLSAQRRFMAILLIRAPRPRRPRHPAPLDAQQQGRGRYGVLGAERGLVHALPRHHQRGLLPDHRSAPGPRPPVPRHRRQDLLPSASASWTAAYEHLDAASPRIQDHQQRPAGALPHHQGDHRRPSPRVCAHEGPPGGGPRPAQGFAALRSACPAPAKSAARATWATWPGPAQGRCSPPTRTAPGWRWGPPQPFVARSCGYVGTTDGWQDLSTNFQMDCHSTAPGPATSR